jgi:tetratricopeptide (TPR) repeat protein
MALLKGDHMRKLVLAGAGAVLLVAAFAQAQVSEGDQHWDARAEGHQGGVAKTGPIDAAIAAYQRAVAQNPNDLGARWKLLRAMRFKGAYVATTNDQKKPIFDAAKKAGEEALTVVDHQLAAKGLQSVSKASEKQVADAARSIDGAGEIFFWDSVNWGEWALAYGKMAAVRQGAADRIRRESTIAMLIDPKLEGGGGARVLGRLHDQTPHVPFITGWASSREAVRYLGDSLKSDPSNKITRVFYAEALVSNSSDAKPQAITMLKEVVSTPNDSKYEVEQAAAQEDARQLLRKWGSS